MADSKKRAAPTGQGQDARANKKSKRSYKPHRPGLKIAPGDVGVFGTCARGKEAKCVNELKNLFEEYTEKLYGKTAAIQDEEDDDASELDVEAGIKAEISDMKKTKQAPPFQNINIEVPCIVFVKTRAPIEPVKLIRSICQDADRTGQQKTRFTQRLVPMEAIGDASEEGLEKVAKPVLSPHFHCNGGPKKFAIRPSIRHSDKLNRDVVIRKVAHLVGDKHKVDLKNYDLLILVEVYKNICGLSVIPGDFEQLKRLNLAEIYAAKTEDVAKDEQ